MLGLRCATSKAIPRGALRVLLVLHIQKHPAELQKFPKLSKTGLSLLNGLLTYDPEKRLTARQALKHPYFQELPLATLPHNMPYFPSAHDADANDDQHKRCDYLLTQSEPKEQKAYAALAWYNSQQQLHMWCRRVAVDAVEAQVVKRRRTQVDVDSAFANVF